MNAPVLAWLLAVVVLAAALGAAALAVRLRRALAAEGVARASAERRAAAAEAEIATRRREVDDARRELAASEAARRAALESRAGLEAAFDRLPIPVWRRGADLALIDCNRAFALCLETDRESAIRERRSLGGEGLADLALAARTPQSETRHVVIAGTRRLFEFHEAPLDDGTLVGIGIDVTEREDAEGALARHQAAQAEVLENLNTAIAIYGADKRLKFFNSAYARLWKLDRQWLATEPDYGEVLEVLRERRRLPEYADFRAFKASRLKLFTTLVEPIEDLVYIPDGTTLQTRTVPHPMGGLFFTYEDVTDRLVLERSLNTLIAVQRETLDNLYEGVAVIGADGRLKLTNPAYARMWRLPPESLAAEPHIADIVERCRDYFPFQGEWGPFKERVIARVTARTPFTGRMVRRDGSTLDYAQVPLPDGAVLLSYLDVTDTVRVEDALRERAAALETADRLKSEFISNVSYELRTPLNTIIGFAEILAQQYFGPLNPRQQEYSRGILVSSERLLSIINDILDLASIEAGQMTLERGTVNLRALVESVAALMQEPARVKSLKVDIECDADAGSIAADERRLKQALCNLVSNAIKFTPSGGLVCLGARREGAGARFVVRDSGVGIAADDRDRVFLPFERGSADRRVQGAGLGLSLVKRIIELHGGRVTLDSAPARGTTVTCTVPDPVPSPPNAPTPVESALEP